MKHFTFEQFAVSTTAQQKGIDNSVPSNLRSHAEELVNTILDPLVDAWGSDVYMSSGFRCEKLNNAIGGSKTSAHSHAYAADLVPKNGNIEQFKDFTMHWLLDNNINFDQYINEYKGKSSWVHIGVRNGGGQQRKQYMLFKDGKYTSINPHFFKGGTDAPMTVIDGEVEDKGMLSGKSVYLKEINLNAIKNNPLFKKGDDGEPILDANGEFIIGDDYLIGANESVSDNIEDISELEAEPINIDLSSISMKTEEFVRGISYNEDGSYVVKQSKSIQQILSIVQQWWETVQTLKKIDFENIQESIQQQKEVNFKEAQQKAEIKAKVYMHAAFDKYGHAYKKGMTCPVCGKHAQFLPPGGYCSVECLFKDAKDKSLAFLKSPNVKYAWLQDVVNQLCAILDLTNILLNCIVMIPDIIKELASLPEEYKVYCRMKIAEGFMDLQELIEKATTKKNEELQKILKPINFGIIAKPVAMAYGAIDAVRQSLDIATLAFNLAYDIVMNVVNNLCAAAERPPGLKIPAESFAWALTPRSFMSPMPYTNSDAGKIFVVLPGGSGLPLQGAKPLMPSALENIDAQKIDNMVQKMFPPLTPVDYYLEPALFQIRFLFSDQSDLVTQLRQMLEDLLVGGPDYIPKFENLLPVKTFTINGKQIPAPNLGYVWFLLGLMDAWAPHSQALVGSILNPAV